ncbi:hypothetical protein CDAR_474911 [Caerostris darwini]|uniref:Uncharacterized protein n=1 Tax=Caerostris darwini TaxID=1538125 RepID=A0AAV4MS63_9ARAC|nr:hypothetical protein CDAR_474911 [Caerostris darwini]
MNGLNWIARAENLQDATEPTPFQREFGVKPSLYNYLFPGVFPFIWNTHLQYTKAFMPITVIKSFGGLLQQHSVIGAPVESRKCQRDVEGERSHLPAMAVLLKGADEPVPLKTKVTQSVACSIIAVVFNYRSESNTSPEIRKQNLPFICGGGPFNFRFVSPPLSQH